MSPETVARTIQLIIAPVVMVTACALLVGGILSRYATVNDRLRLLAHERLELLRAMGGEITIRASTGGFTVERLQEIDTQLPDLLRRHKLLHDAALTVYGAILVYMTCMFVIALAVVTGSAQIATGVLLLFLAGTGVLFMGVVLTAMEVRTSERAIRYEVQRVSNLGK